MLPEYFSHEAALTISLSLSALSSLAMLAAWAYPMVFIFSIGGWLLIFLMSISFGFSVLLITFPTLNVILQINKITIGLIHDEITSGIIFLRITSIIVGVRFFWNCLFSLKTWIMREQDPPYFIHKFRGLSQYGIFAVAIIILGTMRIDAYTLSDSRFMTILNFVLFFFVDDWIIISDYTEKFSCTPMKFHKLRMGVANILIIGLSLIILFSEYHFFFFIIGIVIFSILLFWSYYQKLEIDNAEHNDGAEA